jgi:hypothetical protein
MKVVYHESSIPPTFSFQKLANDPSELTESPLRDPPDNLGPFDTIFWVCEDVLSHCDATADEPMTQGEIELRYYYFHQILPSDTFVAQQFLNHGNSIATHPAFL